MIGIDIRADTYQKGDETVNTGYTFSMFGLLLIGLGTSFGEVSESIGKIEVASKRQSIYSMAFLSLSLTTLILLLTIFIGESVTFKLASLPYFIPRLILEILLAFLTVKAIISADRTTFTFIRLISIPLLLTVDIILGYTISIFQVCGILGILLAVAILLGFTKQSRKGAALTATTAVLSVATISLYKYDITNFNSVVAEQAIVCSVLVLFFGLMAKRQNNENVFKLFLRPLPVMQAMAGGASSVLESFAYGLAPASIILGAKRGFSVCWSIISGQRLFDERSLRIKISAFVLVVGSLVLLTIN